MEQTGNASSQEQKQPDDRTFAQAMLSQNYGRKVVASLGASGRPSITPWHYGTAGTAPDSTRFVLYNRYIRAGGSRAWRINNPGNIYINAFSRANGAIGHEQGYAIFPDMQTGKNALTALLHSSAYSTIPVHELISNFVSSGNVNTKAQALSTLQSNIDPAASLGSLTDTERENLSQAIVSSEESQPGNIYIQGSPLNPPWTHTVFAAANANPASSSGSGSTGDGKAHLGIPSSWQFGIWYERQPDGFVVAPTQDSKSFPNGIYLRYDGPGQNGIPNWDIHVVGTDNNVTPTTIADLYAHPDGDNPNYYEVDVFHISVHDTITSIHYAPGEDPSQEPGSIPPNATVIKQSDGSTLVQFESNDDPGGGGSDPGGSDPGGSDPGGGDPGGSDPGGNGPEPQPDDTAVED